MSSSSPLVLLFPALLGIQRAVATGAYTVIPLDVLLRDSADDTLHVSWTVGSLKLHPPSLPGVYLLGGSAARESIVSDSSLAAAIRSRGGPAVSAYDLSSSNQNFAESLAIVDNLPSGPGVVLVGVNPTRFVTTPAVNEQQTEGRELLLDSPTLRQYLADHYGIRSLPLSLLPGIFGYLSGYLQNHKVELRELRIPHTTYRLHRYSAAHIDTAAQKRQTVQSWNKLRAPAFRSNLAFNLGLLQELVKRARDRGYAVVLLELPLNLQIIGSDFDWVTAAYRPRCKAIAKQYGATYIDLNSSTSLTSDDFYDIYHLVGQGREIWQNGLARQLVPVLDQLTQQDGGQPSAGAS